ncbi:ATP-dependent DNA helicase PIF1-like protein [Tanacetum coccineum]
MTASSSHPHCESIKGQQNQESRQGGKSLGRDGQIFMFNPDYLLWNNSREKPCYSPNWDVDTRWNSTFEMFESGLKQKMTLAYFHDILVTKNGRRFKKFPDEYWVLIESLNPLLEVFQNATVILSGVYYPTSPLRTKNVYTKVITAVEKKYGGVFFLYGYGGTGKTYVWRTLSAALCSKGEIILNVASSGITSLLLSGSRTAHSRLAVTINVNE